MVRSPVSPSYWLGRPCGVAAAPRADGHPPTPPTTQRRPRRERTGASWVVQYACVCGVCSTTTLSTTTVVGRVARQRGVCYARGDRSTVLVYCTCEK